MAAGADTGGRRTRKSSWQQLLCIETRCGRRAGAGSLVELGSLILGIRTFTVRHCCLLPRQQLGSDRGALYQMFMSLRDQRQSSSCRQYQASGQSYSDIGRQSFPTDCFG